MAKKYEVAFENEADAGETEFALRDGWGHCVDTELDGNTLRFSFDDGVERKFPNVVKTILQDWFNGKAVAVPA